MAKQLQLVQASVKVMIFAAHAKLLHGSAMLCHTDLQETKLSDSGACFQRTQQNQPQQNLSGLKVSTT